jgi:hypothetical protein
MAEQFGEPSTLSAEKLAEADEWLKAQPVAGESRSAEEVMASTEPAVPDRLSGKVRGLLAYARGKNLNSSHVIALNAMHHGTAEPLPIGGVADEDVDPLKELIDQVATGDIEFVSPNGVLIAKEKTPA